MAGVQERACRWVVIVVCAAAFGALCACGGGGGSAAPAPEAVRTGDVGIQVAWPAERLVPAASASIKVEVLRNGTPIDGATVTIDAPATTGRINGVATGDVTLRATAYPEAGATGTPQATGDLAVTVIEGFQQYGTLSMASTIASFAVTPNPASTTVEGTVSLTATAKNAADQVVLLPDAASWSIETGSEFVSLPSSRAVGSYSATVTGKAIGSATVKVSFAEASGSTRSATATVNVTPPPWPRQFGTSGQDGPTDIKVGAAGNVYVCGFTSGSLFGPSAGNPDVFVVKYDASGSQSWGAQLGTVQPEQANALAVDGSGNVYVCGYTGGALGGSAAGNVDAFLAKLDASGNQLWLKQFGTAAGDIAYDVALDSAGNAYLVGTTEGDLVTNSAGNSDAFVIKYDSDGSQVWGLQFGTTGVDGASTVCLDGSGDLLIGGTTRGLLGTAAQGGQDGWVAKYTAAGVRSWIRQYGTAGTDSITSSAVDGMGNVVLVGHSDNETSSRLPTGRYQVDFQVLVAKYDGSGNQLFQKLYGAVGAPDQATGVAADASGNFYVTGYTTGAAFAPKLGDADAFLVKCDPTGTQLWGKGLGEAGKSSAGYATALDGDGNVFLVGVTTGNIAGPSLGGFDGFIYRYTTAGTPI